MHDLHVLLLTYSTGSLLKHSIYYAVDRCVGSPGPQLQTSLCSMHVELCQRGRQSNYTLISKEKRRATLGGIQTRDPACKHSTNLATRAHTSTVPVLR